MRARLIHGKLVPPSSLEEAHENRRLLAIEIERIETHLSDPARPLRYPSAVDYQKWCTKAKHTLRLFRSEDAQLVQWIESQQANPEHLLKEAYAIFRKLLDDDVELFDEELAVIENIGKYFSAKVAKKSA